MNYDEWDGDDDANEALIEELRVLVRIVRHFNKAGNTGQVEHLLEYAADKLLV